MQCIALRYSNGFFYLIIDNFMHITKIFFSRTDLLLLYPSIPLVLVVLIFYTDSFFLFSFQPWISSAAVAIREQKLTLQLTELGMLFQTLGLSLRKVPLQLSLLRVLYTSRLTDRPHGQLLLL